MKGKSYQNSDTLAGEDLSGQDVRGANFAGANLTGTNFSGVRTGQLLPWKLALICFAFVASVVSGGLLAIAASYTTMAFSAGGIIAEIAGTVQTELASITGGMGGSPLDAGASTFALPAANTTSWAVVTFFVLLLLFVWRFSRRGFVKIWRYLIGTIALLFLLWILSAIAMSVGLMQEMASFAYLSLVGMAAAFGIIAFLLTCVASLLGTMLLATTLAAANSIGKGWMTGVLAIVAGIVALLWALAATLPIMEEMKLQGVGPSTILLSVPMTVGVVVLLSASAAWVSWRTINRQAEFAGMRRRGLRCAAIGGD